MDVRTLTETEAAEALRLGRIDRSVTAPGLFTVLGWDDERGTYCELVDLPAGMKGRVR